MIPLHQAGRWLAMLSVSVIALLSSGCQHVNHDFAPVEYSGRGCELPLSVGEKIAITFHTDTASTYECEISTNGTINLPLIGSFPAAGRSLRELAAQIKAAYHGYLP